MDGLGVRKLSGHSVAIEDDVTRVDACFNVRARGQLRERIVDSLKLSSSDGLSLPREWAKAGELQEPVASEGGPSPSATSQVRATGIFPAAAVAEDGDGGVVVVVLEFACLKDIR